MNMAYLRNAHIILLKLSEFPSILILFSNFILNNLIHKYIGKKFLGAEKIFIQLSLVDYFS